ncbi:AraC family transcriptional regulator [Paenibacillus sedimenti]|uniref:Helix-turn-helix transcriptional regulator n=1 Tax=Paenibacillus sedimenti TaxID=2770274 RepID=A0A926KR71_9BACL|nr:AraC family transcriptional regulator [Paenibacillus sedimenti]MBD0381426.1 helix-turn-helix transcriptional regulator [Paenibacillus sedimenti]
MQNHLKFLDHVYWEQKQRFLLEEDTYPCWTLFAIEEGRFRYGISKYQGEAAFGDLVFCPPFTPFRRKIIEPLSFHFYSFDCIPSADDIQKDLIQQLPLGKVTLFDQERLASNFFYMKQWQTLNDPVTYERKAHFLQDLWHLYCMERETVKEKGVDSRAKDPLIHELTLWIQRHAFEPIIFKDVAASKGLSPVQLTRRFQQQNGVSPIEYLTHLRLKKAKTLLLETNYTLEQIAQQCGYENGFYLSRVFSKKMKMFPSQFRTAYKL